MFKNVNFLDPVNRSEADMELKPKLKVNNQTVKGAAEKDPSALSNLIYKWNNFHKILRVTLYCYESVGTYVRGNPKHAEEIRNTTTLIIDIIC